MESIYRTIYIGEYPQTKLIMDYIMSEWCEAGGGGVVAVDKFLCLL